LRDNDAFWIEVSFKNRYRDLTDDFGRACLKFDFDDANGR
jgi:hypothetical protein